MAHDCEPTGCFREEQRSRRIRSAPQDKPYIVYTTTTTTAPVTTPTPVFPPDISDLADEVEIPSSGNSILCPTIQTTKPPMYFDAYGGNEKLVSDTLIIHKFNNNGFFSIVPYPNSNFEYATINFLLVGGGGGGGSFKGAGGGGGGQVKSSSYNFPAGTYEVIIGSGGAIATNGENTVIPNVLIKAIGGGAGGSPFSNNAKNGGSGGGAGGRSNSLGGTGFGGNNGGSSIGNHGGAGGGGAASRGQSLPFLENGQFISAGKGGDGIAITYDGGQTYNYYGGGGAGDPFDNSIIQSSIGGGGGTQQKNGINGTGGGGAGNGGVGGHGFCVLSYIPVTTPPPTTTTPPPQRVPSVVRSLTSTAFEDKVSLKWLPPEDSGTSDITEYIIIVTNNVNSTDVEIVKTVDTLSVINENGINFFTYDVLSLQVDVDYVFSIRAKNDTGYSEPVQVSDKPTTTTTTTRPPEFVAFNFEFNDSDNLEFAFVEERNKTIYAPEGAERFVTINVVSSGDYVFYENPAIAVYGLDSNFVFEQNSTITLSSDAKSVNYRIPFIMPSKAESSVSVFFTGTASETTTTSTTPTTTTLPPFCLSIYNSASFTSQDDVDIVPTGDNILLNPLQIFFSRNKFPKEITGTIAPNVELIGQPWYGGTYFEIGRSFNNSVQYIASLENNHNKQLFVKDGEPLFDNLYYRLFYPQVVNNEINFGENILVFENEEDRRYISCEIVLDYICDVNNPNIYGKGESERVNGFLAISFAEILFGNQGQMFSKVIDNFMLRDVGTIVSPFTGEEFYYLIDFGTRDKIVGI